MALPMRPYHPQRFIHQKLHPKPTDMFKHFQCEARRTRSAVGVQHGSSPQAFNAMPTRSHQPLGFSMALPLRSYHLHRFIHQKQIRLNCSSIFNAKPTSPDQPLRFSMALPLRPYHRSTSSIRSSIQIQQKCSSIFTAKPTGPDQPLRSSMALSMRPYHPQRFIHQKLHPNPTELAQASSMRSPPDQISS